MTGADISIAFHIGGRSIVADGLSQAGNPQGESRMAAPMQFSSVRSEYEPFVGFMRSHHTGLVSSQVE